MTSARRLLPVAVFLLYCALAFGPAPFSRDTLLSGFDGRHISYPSFLWLRGQLPFPALWTEALGGGFPLIAESQAQAFYPPLWLALLLPGPAVAYNLYLLAHLFLLFAGGFALCRELTGSPFAALLGAMTMTGGGQVVMRLEQPILVVNAAWLPLIVLLTIRNCTRPDRRRLAFTAIAWALLLLTGHGQLAFLTACLTLPVGLFYACRAGRRWLDMTRQLPIALLLPPLLGAFVAGVQLIPLLAFLPQTVRAHALSAGDSIFMSPWNMFTYLLPFIFGGNGTFWLQERFFYEAALYCGVIPLPFALAGLAARGRHRPAAWLWAGIAAGALLLALGPRTMLQPLLHRLPVLSSMLNPVRYALFAQFALAVLAAYGAVAALRQPRLAARAAAGLAVFLLLLAAVGCSFTDAFAGVLRDDILLAPGEAVTALTRGLSPLALARPLLLLAAVMLFALYAGRRTRLACALLVVLVAADAGWYAQQALQPIALAFSPPAGARRIWHIAMHEEDSPNRLLPSGIEDFDIFNRAALHRHTAFRARMLELLPAALRLSRVDEFHLAPPREYRGVCFTPDRPLGAAMAGQPLGIAIPAASARGLRLVSAAARGDSVRGEVRLYAGSETVAVLPLAPLVGGGIDAASGRVAWQGRFESRDYFLHYGEAVLPTAPAIDGCTIEVRAGTVLVAGLALAGETGVVSRAWYPQSPELVAVSPGRARPRQAPPPPVFAAREVISADPARQAVALAAVADPLAAVVADLPAYRTAEAAELRLLRQDDEYCVLVVTAAETVPLLRLSAWYPEWECFIDGKAAPLAVADVMFQCVMVPPGTHRVEFVYARRAFHAGLALTLFGALTVVGLLRAR